MATNLSQDVGIQLTINAISAVSMLYLIITLFGPISGAHFNPVVTLGELFKNRIDAKSAIAYIVAQFVGGFSGTVFANVIFEKPAIFQSQNERTGTNLFISEIFATAGLIMIIHLLTDQKRTNLAPFIIPAWIATAFYATSPPACPPMPSATATNLEETNPESSLPSRCRPRSESAKTLNAKDIAASPS